MAGPGLESGRARFATTSKVAFTLSQPAPVTAPLFDAGPFRNLFVPALGQVRNACEFHFIGYALMRERFHLSLWPGWKANPSVNLRSLKVGTALAILEPLRKSQAHSWCAKMLARTETSP